MVGKWLEAVHEMSPAAERVLAILNPDTTPAKVYLPALEAAATSFKMKPVIALVHTSSELEPAIASFAQGPHGVMIIVPDAFAVTHRENISSLPHIIAYRRSMASAHLPEQAVCWRTRLTCPTIFAARLSTSTESSQERNQPTFRCRRRPSTSW